MRTIELSDICTAYLEGYIYAKITESLITGQIQSSYLDALKKIAEKEQMKNNYEQWADITLDGIKQRLRDSKKLNE